MSVKVNEIDIKDMVKGGTYDTKKTIGDLKRLPSGEVTSLSWCYPNPFGITVNGKDICNQYTAKYVDYSTSQSVIIPTGVKKLKVVCVGAGTGGTSGMPACNVGNKRYYGTDFGVQGDGITGYKGRTTHGEIQVNGGTFTVTIGIGSAGSTCPNWVQINSLANCHGRTIPRTSGEDTLLQYNTTTVTGNGSPKTKMVGKSSSVVAEVLDDTKPQFPDKGLGGKGGKAMTQSNFTTGTPPAECNGTNGSNGFCRVYFLY